MSCDCGPNETCSIPTSEHKDVEQKNRKLRQYVLFGTVMLLFTLRWFNLVNLLFGIDTALMAILIGAAPIFSRALDSLLKKRLNTEVLISIALIAALSVPEAHVVDASWLGPILNRLFSSIYFPAGSVIIIMLAIETLEIFTLVKMKSAVDKLISMMPKIARIKRGLIEQEIEVSMVKKDDILVVRSGESIPVDGVIIKGNSSLNESAITGESIPIEKTIGDEILSGTICEIGAFEMKATKVGDDTTLARVIKLVQEAQTKKPIVQKYADKMASIFIPLVLMIALVVFLFTNDPVKTAAVLLVACPCALSMATPAAVVAGIGNGARKGIIIKGGIYLESAAKIDCVVFDKTGTLTVGKPKVTDVLTFGNLDSDKLLTYAASAEKLSEHALSISVINEAERKKIKFKEPESFNVFPGKGVSAIVDGKNIIVGNHKMFDSHKIKISNEIENIISKKSREGKTILIVAINKKISGIIAVADIVKDDAKSAIDKLHKLGIKKIVMLSGDNPQVSKAISNQIGIDEVHSSLLPQDKVNIINTLKKDYKVAMVGDGINDAPALSAAHIAIAMGSGTDVSISAADIILKTNHVEKVPEVLNLSRKTLSTIKGNIIFSMLYNVIGMSLSAFGLFVPAMAVIFQEAGCFSVMLNSALLIRRK